MKEALEVLDNVRLNFSPSGLVALNVTIAFIMFGVALDIKIEHFKQLVMRPKSVIVGVISQFVLLPAVTFLFVLLLNPTPTVALGMLLIASCPGGNISNFMSALAKGNLALSVSLTAIATLSATFMTPINFAFWGDLYINFYNNQGAGDYLVPIKIDFLQMIQTVVVLLGIPVILGLAAAQYLPKLTLKIKKPIRKLSIIIFIAFVVVMLNNNFEHFKNFIHLIFLIVLIHNALALLAGFSISSVFRLPKIDKRTITIETGIQNSALALVLMFNPKIFPPELELGGMTIIAAWWGVWHILSGFAVSSFMARFKLTK
ncbi:bile acid:sodium symporter family protein [Draconibacterium sp. IB214405]|uniref:bile acid:sodium symporter family protein n=1 Tax=Draconibacterium sp. IB214405 TaxID=3097352 RepID=UPI002A147093|nr:bile acid:sodium symporter family protein [Draconibacterium sp. IB214405]MDX8338568.1 bile acid:sodium symporter family protein [Draconibacterium sp. IB214405]